MIIDVEKFTKPELQREVDRLLDRLKYVESENKQLRTEIKMVKYASKTKS